MKYFLIQFFSSYFLGDELAAGGKDGFGKGIASFAEHVVGGTFLFLNKSSGGFAKVRRIARFTAVR